MSFIEALDTFNKYGWLLLIVLLERLFPARSGTPLLPRGWISDLIHMYEPYVRNLVVGGTAALLVPRLSALPGGGVLADQSLIVNILVVIVVNEATVYWAHRLLHSVPWLWEFHKVHHSPTTYYSLIATRFHFVDMFVLLLPFILITAWMGARMEVQIGYSVFLGLMDRYAHSNIRSPHFTGYFLITPHFHAWHHATGTPQAYNKNFSRVFSFMDWLHGTVYYPKGEVPQRFGNPRYPVNYFVQQAFPFVVLGRKIAARFKRPQGAAANLDAEPLGATKPDPTQS